MPLPDLGTEIIAGAIALIAVLVSFVTLKSKRKRVDVRPPAVPKADDVANAARVVVVEEAEREADAVAAAVADEHPATALADLLNSRRRER